MGAGIREVVPGKIMKRTCQGRLWALDSSFDGRFIYKRIWTVVYTRK